MSTLAKAILGEAQKTMPLVDVLSMVEPTDMGRTWEEAFRSIELNHYRSDPAHWDKFLDSIRQNGIKHPVYIEIYNGRLQLLRGHHRVWAAHKLGIQNVPVTIATRK
jgi:hypothetical protein